MADSIELGRAHYTVGADTTEFKRQISALKREAQALSTIARGFDNAARVMMRSVIAPTLAMGALGLRKYLKTTEDGAVQLRKQIVGLRTAWNQALARIGEVIVKHGLLTKVINILKNVLDKLSSEKIERIFTAVKWATVLYVLLKIVSTTLKWMAMMDKIIAAYKTIQMMSIATPAIAGAARQVGATAGTSAIGTVLGTVIGLFTSELYKATKKVMTAFPKITSMQAKSLLGGGVITAREVGQVGALSTVPLIFVKIGAFFKAVGVFLKSFTGVLAAILMVIPILIGMFQGFRDALNSLLAEGTTLGKIASFVSEFIKSSFNRLIMLFKSLGIVIKLLFSVLKNFGYAIGAGLETIIKGGIFTKGGRAAMVKISEKIREDIVNTIGKAIYNMMYPEEAKELDKIPGKGKQFKFGHTYMGGTGAAELNKVFQELALENQIIDIGRKQLMALQNIERNTAPAGSNKGVVGATVANSGVFKQNFALA